MIIEEIQGNIANLSQDEKQNMSKKFILKTQIWLNVYNVKTDHGNEIGYVLNNLLTYNMVIFYIKTIQT